MSLQQTTVRVDKPWGHELWWAETNRYAGKLLHVEAGHELSLQVHEQKDETSYVLSGSLVLTYGPSMEELAEEAIGPGHAWRVEPETIHSIRAVTDSLVLEVSTPDLDDVVRLRDRYDRAPREATEATQPGLACSPLYDLSTHPSPYGD